MSILLVYPAVLVLVAAILIIVRRSGPRTGRPLLRTAAFVVGVLITAPIMMLIGFAGVAKRL